MSVREAAKALLDALDADKDDGEMAITRYVTGVEKAALDLRTALAADTVDTLIAAPVTRVEVIDHSPGGAGRVYVIRGNPVTVVYQIQDRGRTLKIFISAAHEQAEGEG